MVSPKRILYIVHDGQLYGSQHSLLLLLRQLCDPEKTKNGLLIQPHISVARSGPLLDRLLDLPGVTIHQHKRLQWFKHDQRSLIQTLIDRDILLLSVIPRVLPLVRLIKDQQIDLVHTNSIVSLEGALAAKLAGVPHVWHIRELFMFDNPKLYPVLRKSLTKWLIHGLSDRIICISQAVREQFGSLGRQEKYQVIHNALDSECFPLLSSTHSTESSFEDKQHTSLRIGYLGRLSEGKRLHDLLTALATLNRKLSPSAKATLTVAGNFVDAPYEARIHEQVKSLGLTDQVSFIGYTDDTATFYRQIDLLVTPSYNEPFGRVVIEAMAAGIPCIGTDSGGIPEIITHGESGWLYPAGDTEALARQLASLVRDREAMSRIRQNALRTIRERFTIEQQIQELVTVYEHCFATRFGQPVS